jgi:hypothetical protein
VRPGLDTPRAARASCAITFARGDRRMSTTLMEARVIEGLRALPRDRVEEVLDFIEFLTARESTHFLAGRLTESLAALEVMELPELVVDDLLALEAGRRLF